ncbi:hypothetical protein [Streptomyces bluensis]|uniref:Uncharacterized protein n=1 Tax=Streptomyces bluensis TaxID=33897 RepID=A0ABW6UXY3_9ACTN
MTAIEHAAAQQTTTPVGPVVWILSEGELSEGGTVLGVYLDRDLARGDFLAKAQELNDRFSIDDARQDANGGLHITGGCDWISLEPHSVVTAPQIHS